MWVLPRSRIVPGIVLAATLALAGCTDEDPTGPPETRFDAPQLVTVGSFSDFVQLDIQSAPPVAPNFAEQYQGLWVVDADDIFLSRGDDHWLEIDVSGTTATVVSSLRDPAPVSVKLQFGGWAASAHDFWGADEDGVLFRFDAGGWSLVDTGFGPGADFRDVWGFASNDVWAVGGDRTGGTSFVAHYDGVSWSQDPSVPSGPNILWSAWGPAPGDVWAVSGNGAILRNQSGSWSVAATFPVTFRDIHGSSASNAWAVGWDNDGGRTFRWTGNQWTPVPFPFDVTLWAVQALGPSDVYAAGGRGIYHYDGESWSKIDHPALQDPDGGFDLTFWDMRIADGRLFAASPQGFLVMSDPLPVDNQLDVTVLEPGGASAAPNVAVTLTDVGTGEFYVECTDGAGFAPFTVPDGSYIVHARNLEICSNAFLRIWPEPTGTLFSTANTEAENRVGVIDLNGQSEPLTPQSYRDAAASPLTLSGGTSQSLTLTFQEGATLTCTLLDDDGNPFTLSDDEQLYNVLPFVDETGLPPVSNPAGLPRGIGLALATIFSGELSDDCSVSGMPAGDYVLETNEVDVDGETVVFREAFEVTDQEASSGSTVEVETESTEPLFFTHYIFDPLGDSRQSIDLGPAATFGWIADTDPNAPGLQSDVVVVRSNFRGSGETTLHLRHFDPVTDEEQSVRATADCTVGGCALLEVTPRDLAGTVEVEGTVDASSDQTSGSVTWRVTIPDDVVDLEVRILGGSRGRLDRAPDRGFEDANKFGDGNSFMIKGD